ncbi:hypothetical protein J437_LFUL017886 [Ladona fulva]|uniref:Reverse transcriptase n=1 Tax=Ladona fulva TaxID=123851 RepID=A0A8K0K948_LADFU|nr:hypothetical protein J437_LFUL017886 [Ladona fulva]
MTRANQKQVVINWIMTEDSSPNLDNVHHSAHLEGQGGCHRVHQLSTYTPTLPRHDYLRTHPVRITLDQCDFVKDCRTINAIYMAQLLIKKHWEKNKMVHLALEKAFDQIPHKLIWHHYEPTMPCMLI